MTQITKKRLYLPRYRIATSAIQDQWGGGTKGVQTKVVQAKDDDSVTLAVRAGQAVLDDQTNVDAVFFATTTPSYGYGSVTPFIAEVLGQDEETYVQTFGESSRAGTAALRAAHDTVANGSDAVLVVAAEAPTPAPQSDWEKVAGAGASAVLVEASGDGLQKVASDTNARPLLDEWRESDGMSLSFADDRFSRDVGYVETTKQAVTRAMDDADWSATDVDTLIVNHPNGKFAKRLARAVDVGEDALATSSLGSVYGNLRSVSTMASLALSDVTAGERVLVAGYGVGTADALAYEASSDLASTHVDGETIELDYIDYLEHVNQLE